MNASRSLRCRVAAALLAGLAALLPLASHACGACVEDQVAATYDHQVVQRAAAAGDVMVYCKVDGPLDARRLLRAARGVTGIRPQSVRTSVQPAALSFAVDPSRQSAAAAVAATQRALPAATRLTVIRLLPAPPAFR